MAPIRESVSIKRRYDGPLKELDPFKNYYISAEGTRTEPLYLKHFINNRKKLGIRNNIEIIPLERTSFDEGRTQPDELLNIIVEFRNERRINGYDSQDDDVYCIMFDRDSYKNDLNPRVRYLDFVKRALKENIYLIVTSPCFELWLIMHHEDSVKNYILPNYQDLLFNPKISHSHTVASKMFIDIFGYSPKSQVDESFIDKVDVAIKQSNLLSKDIYKMNEELGQTVSNFILKIKTDLRFIND